MNELIKLANKDLRHSDKKIIETQIRKLLKVGEIARAEGLLGLESSIKEFDDRKDDLLSKGLSLLVEGTSPKLISDILISKIYANGKIGADLLCQIITVKGILAIQEGTPRIALEELLKSCVNDDFVNEMSEDICIEVFEECKKTRSIVEYRQPDSQNENLDGFLTTEEIEALLLGINL